MKRKPFKKAYCEICGICNLRCDFCPLDKNARGLMSVDFFRKVVEEISPWVETLYLHVLGEPLLHPKFVEMIDIAQEAKLPVHLVTNGVLLGDKYGDFALHQGISEVSISLQSFAASEGEEDLDEYLQGVFNFCVKAEEIRPELRINLRIWNLMNYSELELENNIYFCWLRKAFGNEIFSGAIAEHIHSRGVNIRGNLSVNFSQRFQWPLLANEKIRNTGYCAGMTQQFGILADGTVVPCCLDDKGIVNLGNLKEQSFLEIMNSSRAQAMVDGLENGVLTEPLCCRCEFGSRFKRKLKRGGSLPK